MKKVKIASIVLASVSVVSAMSGCVQKKEGDDTQENVTLKYIMIGPGKQEDSDEVWMAFNEKLHEHLPNVDVEFEIFPISDYKQQFMLMQTSDEQIDIVNMYGLTFPTEVENGTLAPLDELLEKYGADVKAALPEWLWEYMKIDGVQYGIPSYQMLSTFNSYAFQQEQADKYLDKEALKKALYSSNHITDDVYKILEDYMQKLKDNGELYLGINQWKPEKGYEGVLGNYNIDIDDPECKVMYGFRREDAKKNYERNAQWYKKGFIREDSLSANDNSKQKGKKDGFVIWDEQYTPWLEENLEKSYGMDIELIPLTEKYYISKDNAASGTGIMASSKHKEEAMQVLNLLQSDRELYNLLVFGIEGKHYNKISDTRIETPYESGQGSMNDKYGIYKWIVGNTSLAYDTQNEPEGYSQWWQEDVNSSTWRSRLIGFIPDTTAIADKVDQINAIKGEYMASLTSGSLDNWEQVYDEWMKKIEAAGNSEVEAELQRQIDEFLKSKK
ncbi:MAG: ABC transporter substrate-binding protein [Clostridia bacterium]|nr:ABC transporter substrate-binding protein [Clostridia bacterium]